MFISGVTRKNKEWQEQEKPRSDDFHKMRIDGKNRLQSASLFLTKKVLFMRSWSKAKGYLI
jgi:hypothetical protein